MSLRNSLDAVRQPEYVGENRCLPCSVVNVAIALAGSAAVAGALAVAGASMPLSLGVGGIFLVGSVAVIYLRGYLVPGTPILTKRYMPAWLLRLFGKAPEPARNESGDVDVEAVLFESDAIEECADRDDLCLSDSFETAWHSRLDVGDDGAGRRALFAGATESVDPAEVTLEKHPGAYVAVANDVVIGRWESRAAYLADAAAAAVLRDRYAGWNGLAFVERTAVAGGLRPWLDRCPECGGTVELNEGVVHSCCRERKVAASSCNDCGSRLFEVDV